MISSLIFFPSLTLGLAQVVMALGLGGYAPLGLISNLLGGKQSLEAIGVEDFSHELSEVLLREISCRGPVHLQD